jgi:hypothetical protein
MNFLTREQIIEGFEGSPSTSPAEPRELRPALSVENYFTS